MCENNNVKAYHQRIFSQNLQETSPRTKSEISSLKMERDVSSLYSFGMGFQIFASKFVKRFYSTYNNY